MVGPLGSLAFLLIVGVPLALFFLRVRRPVRGVPRDVMAVRGKVRAWGWGLCLPSSQAYRDTLIDEAADCSDSDADQD